MLLLSHVISCLLSSALLFVCTFNPSSTHFKRCGRLGWVECGFFANGHLARRVKNRQSVRKAFGRRRELTHEMAAAHLAAQLKFHEGTGPLGLSMFRRKVVFH